MRDPLTTLDSFTSALPEATTLAWLIFFAILLYTVLHAVIFVYHWFTYNIAPKKFLTVTYIVYFAGIGVFMLGLLLSTIAITN